MRFALECVGQRELALPIWLVLGLDDVEVGEMGDTVLGNGLGSVPRARLLIEQLRRAGLVPRSRQIMP
jgi:hypothetical protein